MPGPRRRTHPIVTLTTDFGTRDSYVAEMKAVLLSLAPSSPVVDVTHEVPPQDVTAASFVLGRVLNAFPPGSIHLVVVDPGVGSDRRLLLARINGHTVVAPDNGLVSWAWQRMGGEAWQLEYENPESSNTFHGRDVMAPVVGRLAAGASSRRFCGKRIEPILLDLRPAESRAEARVCYVDHYGNAVTNADASMVGPATSIRVRGRRVPVRKTYADVPEGEPVALVGSSGLLEIAVRNGSAAKLLRIGVGTVVRVEKA